MKAESLAEYPSDMHNALKQATDLWRDIYNVIRYAPKALLWGPAGTHKSTACATHDLGISSLERFSISPETSWPELRGHWLDGPHGYQFWQGPCVRSWLNGSRAVVDEIDQAGGDTIAGLHMWLDDIEIASMTLPTGETVKPKEGFRCFATSNHDPKTALPEALADRFVIKRFVSHPNPVMLASFVPELRVAAAYSLYSSESGRVALTTRGWCQVNRFMRKDGLDAKQAFALVLGPKMANDAVKACKAACAKLEAEKLSAVTESPSI